MKKVIRLSTVYFIRNTGRDYSQLGKDAAVLLQKVAYDTGYAFPENLPIKVHFGEEGNKTFIPPVCYEAVIRYLQEKGVNPSYIETNVLYRGSRTKKEDHIRTALSHGFTQIPITIADGEIGTEYDEVEINKDYIQRCKIGKAYGDYKQFIVISHFKGHVEAGFGGALKQLAMGFAARGGKLEQHSGRIPIVKTKECIACGICAEKCGFDAITVDQYAVIHADKCSGCAGCIATCPEGAIRNSWSGVNFLEKLAEYAYGASKDRDNIYITFIHNVTKDCDCTGRAMRPIAENIGVLAAKDPVALDTACLDLVQQSSGKKLFEDGRTSLRHAEKIGLGAMQYQLVELFR